jgi:hypothetical protein
VSPEERVLHALDLYAADRQMARMIASTLAYGHPGAVMPEGYPRREEELAAVRAVLAGEPLPEWSPELREELEASAAALGFLMDGVGRYLFLRYPGQWVWGPSAWAIYLNSDGSFRAAISVDRVYIESVELFKVALRLTSAYYLRKSRTAA